MKKTIWGFTLIELMIVIIIVGILSTLALPSYHDYLKRARFLEVLTAAEPFKVSVGLALQAGYPSQELKNNNHGVPPEPTPTANLASIKVENAIITALGSELVNHATYILKPSADGSRWTISGSCLKLGLCDN